MLTPSEIVAIITDNSTTIGSAQRVDIEEEIALNSGVKTLQQFLAPMCFTIAFICCIFLRVLNNSTRHQAQAVASKIVNKRATRNSLRLSCLPYTATSTNSVTNDYSASSATYTIKSKSKDEKKVPKPSNKNLLNVARKQRKQKTRSCNEH